MRTYLPYFTGIFIMIGLTEYNNYRLMNLYKKSYEENQKAMVRLNKLRV